MMGESKGEVILVKIFVLLNNNKQIKLAAQKQFEFGVLGQ